MAEKHYSNPLDMIRDLIDDQELITEVESAVLRQRIIRQLMAMRAVRGLSQGELASRLDCTQSRVSKLESSADDDLRFGDLKKYAAAVGCEIVAGVRPSDLTPTDEVKCLASAVNDRLSRMAELSHCDESIAAGVTKFLCEAFVNFSMIVGRAASALPKNADGSPRIRMKVDVSAEELDAQESIGDYPPEVKCMLQPAS